ncbi:MAG: hypothetical protein NZ526_02130 [Aquificaceae bacterium]|nr:hypothetical protein [Aquificaceae bacterium]MCS7307331.1 hypothetical protein [Aquificaceae bacterium]
MEKSEVLGALLVQDRLIRFNLQMLETLGKEIKADIEEMDLIAQACLSREELEIYREALKKIKNELLSSISEAVEELYDLYEVFNFDITFLSTLPEELARDIERLDVGNSINSKLQLVYRALEDIIAISEEFCKVRKVLTPMKVYKELIIHGMEFNRRLYNISFQKIE